MKSSKFVYWLKKRSLTTNEFVELIKCNRTTVWYWRKGLKKPGPKMMRKIRAVTNNEIFYPEDFWDK